MSIDSERLGVREPSAGEVSAARRRWSLVLRTAGTVVLLTAVLVGFLAWWQLAAGQTEPGAAPTRVTLIIGDWFPTLWDVEIAAIALGISALVVAAMIAPPVRRRGRMIRIVMGSVLTVLVVLSVPMTAIVSFGSGGYRVLPEQSEGGCRIVVREWSFLLAGSGSVGIVQPSALTVDWTRAYRADDGLRPFSSGSYALQWAGPDAHFLLGGTGADPIWWTAEGPLVCDR